MASYSLRSQGYVTADFPLFTVEAHYPEAMGDAVSTDTFTPSQRSIYRERLSEDLERFDTHLSSEPFQSGSSIGLELELNLVDEQMAPALRNREVLDLLDEDFQSEVGAFNIEVNHPPLEIAGDGLLHLEEGLSAKLAQAQQAAREAGCEVAMIGTLPTMTAEVLEDPSWMTPENRYKALSTAVKSSRGELIRIEFSGRESILHQFADIAPEATCTSVQLHLQVPPTKFADSWNASQAIAAVQVALAANSPLFLGRKLWHESRIPVFRQSIDTRTPDLTAQGVRPRVWFGERWITSVFDLFEENVRYFSPLLPESQEAAGTAEMVGATPSLHYLNLHNGTVWRWTRPIYDPKTTPAHLRVESRLLPAGPTPIDVVADAAFYYGMVKYLTEETRPVWSRLQFHEAHENFVEAARNGIHARITWPTIGHIGVAELVTRHLAPQARAGLAMLGVDEELIEAYMGIIEARARTGVNGAIWQLRTLDRLEAGAENTASRRRAALTELLRLYLANQATGEPVHTWQD